MVNDERVQRYAKALGWRRDIEAGAIRAMLDEQVQRVMAVADAELAELRSENERLREERDAAQEHVAYHLRDYSLNGEAAGDLAVDMAAYSGRLRIRAEAAERELADERAIRARVEVLLCEYETTQPKRPAWQSVANNIRAALAGPERCHADRDGDCWETSVCPQLRDGEPKATGRHCPLDIPEVTE
jgi:hypothetical protein